MDVTVIVVDRDDRARGRLLEILRQQGIRAIGVGAVDDAVALSTALAADWALVRANENDATLAPLRRRVRVVQVAATTAHDEAARVLTEAVRAEVAAGADLSN